MDTDRRATIVAGALYITATASYLVGGGLIGDALAATDGRAAIDEAQMRLGVLLELVNVAAVAGIGLLLLPILRRVGERLAIGYAATRLFEATMLTVSAGAPLTLAFLPPGEGAGPAQLAAAAMAWHDATFQLAMIGLGAGSLLLCAALYRGHLVPRAFPVLGLVGYVALLVNGVLEVLGMSVGMVLYAPGALFEVLFPLWLIVKGLAAPAEATRPVPAA